MTDPLKPPEEPIATPGSIRLWLQTYGLTAFAVLLGTIGAVLIFTLVPQGFLYKLAYTAALAFMLIWWVKASINHAETYIPHGWQLEADLTVPDNWEILSYTEVQRGETINNIEVPDHVLYRAMTLLSVDSIDGSKREDHIYWLTRRSDLWLFLWMLFPASAGLISLGAALVLRGHGWVFNHYQYTGHGTDKKILNTTVIHPAGWLLVLALLCAIACSIVYIQWSCWCFMVTNVNIRIMFLPPPWLPFINLGNKPLRLARVAAARPDDLAGSSKVGAARLGTTMQHEEDRDFQYIPWLPWHRRIVKVIEVLRPNVAVG